MEAKAGQLPEGGSATMHLVMIVNRGLSWKSHLAVPTCSYVVEVLKEFSAENSRLSSEQASKMEVGAKIISDTK